ncbi:conserved protein of unknown function [Rhodovastum atsumiense]|uniref:Uncharacterized protein n=1 Tax=Rhodovastum atsumiense TaxID=504468 RepID=A0A5M6IXK3_9PROT|nr:hypothetical protein [Rhodovastum atsumiense]KAA5612567.1 hypothetical protein F1189_08915 [Rhodovastum atsumiense]CAH2601347.1 conserved protein of unknown function [Rhodovastum atsumiense]
MSNQPGAMAAGAPIEQQLRILGDRAIATFGSADQQISLSVVVTGGSFASLRDVILPIAQEMLRHAVEHGMAMLRQGRIDVSLIEQDGSTVLSVHDNGWALLEDSRAADTMASIAGLAAPCHGVALLRRNQDVTEAVVVFPATPAGTGMKSRIDRLLLALLEPFRNAGNLLGRSQAGLSSR